MTYWEERRDGGVTKDGRTPYERDYARVVHSAAFRRLQAKTQVLGVGDSDFYRTRLTHSMEVSQIGEGIARRFIKDAQGDEDTLKVLPDPILIRTICLAHDLGHPPFGHGGEIALNRCMIDHGGFEGNGQTLRIMALIEPYHETLGMNLSRRSLLGVLKYPAPLSAVVNKKQYEGADASASSVFKAKPFKPPKCYLDTETEVVNWIAKDLGDWPRISSEFEDQGDKKHKKTQHHSLDTSIMEIADDIAYGVHDLEDAIGLGLIDRASFMEAVSAEDIAGFCAWSDGQSYDDLVGHLFSSHTYQRKNAIGALVDFCIRHTTLNTSNPHGFGNPIFGHQAVLAPDARKVLDVLQELVVKRVIFTTTVQQLEFKGQKIVTELFHAFATDPTRLLPPRDVKRYEEAETDDLKQRVICDYLAGMTDDYATKRYQQLFEPRVGSVFDRI
ncbi:anti-phage deoxyguanosine triphosphatase [uncultured Tateyamaria sp.]|uniref:anti-phage deoxyguanosine triphosphatase n=1 Tax=uncultured Tateyamaria sp. TaxID=455651 RepID=UPI00260FDFFB|nr:anti-phage deoxyguanosine triphosphatase [uncultured Tateyamaria sp.]